MKQTLRCDGKTVEFVHDGMVEPYTMSIPEFLGSWVFRGSTSWEDWIDMFGAAAPRPFGSKHYAVSIEHHNRQLAGVIGNYVFVSDPRGGGRWIYGIDVVHGDRAEMVIKEQNAIDWGVF